MLKFCKSDLFYKLQNEKTLFSIMGKRNSVFSLSLQMKLFPTILSYLFVQSTLNFT